MSASRGDRRPCREPSCTGTAQFGRELLAGSRDGRPVDGQRGWVCDVNAGHFKPASEDNARSTRKSLVS